MLFTIGHSSHSQELFLGLLLQHNIDTLVDVRSVPFSQFTPQFNKNVLSLFLRQNRIIYCPMGKYFGARRDEKELYSPEGYLDFEKTREFELFRKGMDSINKGLAQNHNIALMCTEKDPFDCHRAILVSRAFELDGVKVCHILPDGALQTQDELNARLISQYYKSRDQLSLFADDNETEEELLVKAYRNRNAEIGYHIQKEEL